MHQIVVTVLCRLCPLVPQGELALVRCRKTPFSVGIHSFPPPGHRGQKVTRGKR